MFLTLILRGLHCSFLEPCSACVCVLCLLFLQSDSHCTSQCSFSLTIVMVVIQARFWPPMAAFPLVLVQPKNIPRYFKGWMDGLFTSLHFRISHWIIAEVVKEDVGEGQNCEIIFTKFECDFLKWWSSTRWSFTKTNIQVVVTNPDGKLYCPIYCP